MHCARKIFKAIFVALHVGMIIGVSSLAFAQGGEISGSVKDHVSNLGIQWVLITVKDVTTGKVAATGVTDAEGNYSVAVPALGNYSLEASKRGYGYGKVTAPDLIELSDTIPKQTVNIINGRERVVGVRSRCAGIGHVLGNGCRQELPHPSPGNSGLSSCSSTGMTGLLTPTLKRMGKKFTTRTCQPSGITSSTGPGGSTRTPST